MPTEQAAVLTSFVKDHDNDNVKPVRASNQIRRSLVSNTNPFALSP